MTNREILDKAIRKAIAQGWNEGNQVLEIMAATPPTDKQFMLLTRATIFNQDFAKALWGEIPNTGYLRAANIVPWKYHLQKMVIADGPIIYLGENI